MAKQNLDDLFAAHRREISAAATPTEKAAALAKFIADAERRIAERKAEIELWRHQREELHRNLGGVAIGGMVLPTRVREADALIAQAQGELDRLQSTIVSKKEKLAKLQASTNDNDAHSQRSIETLQAQRRHFAERIRLLREGWTEAKARYEGEVATAINQVRNRIAQLQSSSQTPDEAQELEELQRELVSLEPMELEFRKAAANTEQTLSKLEEQIETIDRNLAELCR